MIFGLGRCLDEHTDTDRHEAAHSLTWDIDYFLVHVQEGGLCFFTSLTQGVDLQGENKWLIVSYTTSHLSVTSIHCKREAH